METWLWFSNKKIVKCVSHHQCGLNWPSVVQFMKLICSSRLVIDLLQLWPLTRIHDSKRTWTYLIKLFTGNASDISMNPYTMRKHLCRWPRQCVPFTCVHIHFNMQSWYWLDFYLLLFWNTSLVAQTIYYRL